jgi:hypothetical protein
MCLLFGLELSISINSRCSHFFLIIELYKKYEDRRKMTKKGTKKVEEKTNEKGVNINVKPNNIFKNKII